MRSGVVVVCAALLAGVGCGGEPAVEQEPTSDASPTTTEAAAASPSRAEYVAKADAFCSEAASSKAGQAVSRSLAELRRTPRSDPAFRTKLGAHFRKVLRLARSLSDEFEAMEPPPEDRERIEEFHRANDEAIARLEDVVEAFERRKDPQEALKAYGAAIAKADRLAEAYGFEVCARNVPED